MKKYLYSIVAVMACLLLVACGAKETTTTSSKEDGPLLVGMEAGYPPFNWMQSDDSNDAVKIKDSTEYANGYDVQIARKIGEQLGREVEIVKIDWDGLIPAVQSGKIDLIIAGMSPKAERREAIDFTDDYYQTQIAMVTLKDSPYASAKTLQDFKDARVTGQLGTLHYDLLTQLDGAKVEQAMKSFPVMRLALQSGKLDAYISEVPEAVSATTANKDLAYVTLSPDFEMSDEDKLIAIGLKKGSPLLQEINKALKTISTEERQQLMEKAIETQPAWEE